MALSLNGFLNQCEEDWSKKKNSPGFPGLPCKMFRIRIEGYQRSNLTPAMMLWLPIEYL
jgi:hypothetical protein